MGSGAVAVASTMDFGAEAKDKAEVAGCELPRRVLSVVCVLSGVGAGEDALEDRPDLDMRGITPRKRVLT